MSAPEFSLEAWGWNAFFQDQLAGNTGEIPARVIVEEKHHYVLVTAEGYRLAQASGKLLGVSSDSEMPKVGDWVLCQAVTGEEKVIISSVLSRRSRLSRKIPGRVVREQVLAANPDWICITQALDRTFNPRLVERFLLMAWESGARPAVVLNKCDLPGASEKIAQCQELGGAGQIDVFPLSARRGTGVASFLSQLSPGCTAVLIGPSGVGKSTLVNRLVGEEVQATLEVRESDSKGRHGTTRRELFRLKNGVLLIDTPGMREFQLWLTSESPRRAFPDITELGVTCRFSNCSHSQEDGCAVLEAVRAGRLAAPRHRNFLKLAREVEALRRRPLRQNRPGKRFRNSRESFEEWE